MRVWRLVIFDDTPVAAINGVEDHGAVFFACSVERELGAWMVDALNEKEQRSEDRRVMVCDCIDSEPHVHISDIEGGIRTVIHT